MMRPNRTRRTPFQPLSFVRVSRRRTDRSLSPQAESLVNLFSHAYDHSYVMLQDTDNVDRITDALRMSMEAVRGARTAQSSQDDAEEGNPPLDIRGNEQGSNNEDNRNDDDDDIDAADDSTESDTEHHHRITQRQEDNDEDDESASTNADGSSFINGDSIDERDRPYTEDSSASRDLTESEYDDDVSEISIQN